VYEKTTQENKLSTTMKSQDAKYKTKEFKGLDKSISDLSGDRDTTSTELAAVMDYYGKLKGRCIAKPESYEERKARRTAEIAGLKEALSILENETAFMQQPAAPQKHSAASGAGGSIIDILEVCESDFSKNLATEEVEEADAVAVYEKTTQENKLSVTMKSQDAKYKTKEFKGLDKSISDLSGDRDTTSTELSAVMDYYGKLKGRCIAKPESYEERKARRTAEIAGLKEALSILENETAFMQRGKRSLRSTRNSVM
jgi:predicted  nucleic acid-binding Zn-ribbon protein